MMEELDYEVMVKDAKQVRIQNGEALNGFWGWAKIYKIQKLNMYVVAIYIPLPFKEACEELIEELKVE